MGYKRGLGLQVPAHSEGLCLRLSQGPAPVSTLALCVRLHVCRSASHIFHNLAIVSDSSGAPRTAECCWLHGCPVMAVTH